MQSKVIGKCIYCGALNDLRREHVVPFALNGNIVLSDASCGKCAAITGAFEGQILRSTFSEIREVLKIKTRKKKKRTGFLPMRFVKSDKEFVKNVPIHEYIPFIPALYVEPPTFLRTGSKIQNGEGSSDARIIGKTVHHSHSQVDELLLKYNADKIRVKFDFSPTDFGRMIAKIAYGFAVLRFGLNGIQDNYIIPAILGESDDLWHFFGCDPQYRYINSRSIGSNGLTKNNALIWADLSVISGNIFVWVRLFPKYDFPVYLVIVGRIKEQLRVMLQGVGWKDA